MRVVIVIYLVSMIFINCTKAQNKEFCWQDSEEKTCEKSNSAVKNINVENEKGSSFKKISNEWNDVIANQSVSDSKGKILTLNDLKPNGDYFQMDENKIGFNSNEEDYLINLNHLYLTNAKPFNPAYSSSVSQECKEQSKQYLKSLKKFRMWALRMHDSSAKIPSGILNGNLNQFGDFDQCLRVNSNKNKNPSIKGQYCLAGIMPKISQNMLLMKHIYSQIQANEIIKSEINDPGHRVPRFSTINWGLCIPSGCSPRDIELSLDSFLQNVTQGTGLLLQVKVDPELCQVQNDVWHKRFDNTTLVVWYIFGAYLIITVMSTIYDYKSLQNKNDWLTIFSLIKNTKEIVSLKEDPNDIKSIHGIRFLNATLLVFAHKTMAEFFKPFANRTEMSEILGQHWTVVGRAASIFTDPFIMFSGFLTTYSLIGRLQRGQKIKLYEEYIGRFLRIAPPLGALILFCTFVLPYLGSGPLWNQVVTNHGEICKQYWWRNLLFIHNYYGFKDMCLTHTHHVGIDTELFAVSPIFILILWKWPKKGAIFIVAVASLTTIHRFYTTYKLRLSNYVFFGTSVQELFDTADLMYILPYYRATVYLMGILLGYVCRVYKDVKLTKNQLKFGWYISTILFLLAFFGPAHMGSINYVYDPLHAANYAAFSPIAWCIFFAWVVWTSHNGYTNKLTDIFSWKGFRITTRLSYAIYLTQFPVFFYNVGQYRSSEHFSFMFNVIINTNEYILMYVVSYALTVLFEMPFTNIKKLLFKVNKGKMDVSYRNSKHLTDDKHFFKNLKD